RVLRLPLVAVLPGRVRGHDCRVVDRGDAVAGRLDASVCELARAEDHDAWILGASGAGRGGLCLLAGAGGDVPAAGRTVVPGHGAHAQAPHVQDPESGP